MDRRSETPEQDGTGISRDMPDQQVGGPEAAPDPWEGTRPDTGEEDEQNADVPDTDVSGTGRRGAVHRPGVHPDHPTPDEPAD
ncbi:hypothetical protein [Streptomyces sp. MST-110588]|uniref:hypothetical protein n=1 Tax=Streptomyces sp. MST-110588 TaxID=2833628 RepID=UPI001F5CF654|nr:hypothetical protein [Streptomyces sp. MST-110588]UNO43459.1 hypothetical protein KGS77_33250 [Streptomyces sp. MST-110588]